MQSIHWLRGVITAIREKLATTTGSDRRLKDNSAECTRCTGLRLLAVFAAGGDRAAIVTIAKGAGWASSIADTIDDAKGLLNNQHFPIIVCDRNVPGLPWQDAVQALAAAAPASCIFLVSNVSDDYLWQEVIQRGGYDVLVNPLQEEPVVHAIEQAFWRLTSSRTQQQFRQPRNGLLSQRNRDGY